LRPKLKEMENIIFKTQERPKSNCFITDDLVYNFELSRSASVTDYYFYGTPQKIYSFATTMNEGLSYGFMHYHIPLKHHGYFCKKYPEFAQPTNQIHYLYTAKPYRQLGYISQLIDYILKDMSRLGFQYLWLRCEIDPKLYYSKGFLTFRACWEIKFCFFPLFLLALCMNWLKLAKLPKIVLNTRNP
jgi:GNAT superfamily N-acetyltransferase